VGAIGPAHYALIALAAAMAAAPFLFSWLMRLSDRPGEALGQSLMFKAFRPDRAGGDSGGGMDDDWSCSDGGGDGGD
jgi:hypothetical protein